MSELGSLICLCLKIYYRHSLFDISLKAVPILFGPEVTNQEEELMCNGRQLGLFLHEEQQVLKHFDGEPIAQSYCSHPPLCGSGIRKQQTSLM